MNQWTNTIKSLEITNDSIEKRQFLIVFYVFFYMQIDFLPACKSITKNFPHCTNSRVFFIGIQSMVNVWEPMMAMVELFGVWTLIGKLNIFYPELQITQSAFGM